VGPNWFWSSPNSGWLFDLAEAYTSPRVGGEAGCGGLSASLSLWKRPLTPTLSPQAGRGSRSVAPHMIAPLMLHATRSIARTPSRWQMAKTRSARFMV
jgi:hypothetical protein